LNQAIHIADGAIFYARDEFGNLLDAPPEVLEVPPGSSTEIYNRVNIDWLTGRAAVDRPEIQN
jgi:hypothetical protein